MKGILAMWMKISPLIAILCASLAFSQEDEREQNLRDTHLIRGEVRIQKEKVEARHYKLTDGFKDRIIELSRLYTKGEEAFTKGDLLMAMDFFKRAKASALAIENDGEARLRMYDLESQFQKMRKNAIRLEAKTIMRSSLLEVDGLFEQAKARQQEFNFLEASKLASDAVRKMTCLITECLSKLIAMKINWALTAQLTGDNPKAEQLLEEVCELDDNHADAKRLLAWFEKGNMELSLPGTEVIHMVKVKKGQFSIGSRKSETMRYEDEPCQSVTLTRDFWIGQFEVTQAQWLAVMGNNPSSRKAREKDVPVESISWEEAKSFCKKVTALERDAGRLLAGYVYSLPTEAQWEYACRAKAKDAYNNDKRCTPDAITCPNLDEVGWYAANSDGKTSVVGKKTPNRLALYDMHGNVWEWCLDACENKDNGRISTHSEQEADPFCEEGPLRACRGGSVNSGPRRCRSAARSGLNPILRFCDVGFRLALIPEK